MVNQSGRRFGAEPPVIALAVAAFLFAETGDAQPRDGWFAGIAAGNSHVEVYRDSWFGWGTWEEGPSDPASLLFAGYRLNEHIAFDVGYLRAGSLEWREDNAVVTGLPGIYDTQTVMDTSAIQLSALGILPFARIWEVYLRGGVSWYAIDAFQEATDRYAGQEFVRSLTMDDRGYLLGIGIGAAIVERWHVWMEYQFFDIDHELVNVDETDSATVDTVILGVDYRFGP